MGPLADPGGNTQLKTMTDIWGFQPRGRLTTEITWTGFSEELADLYPPFPLPLAVTATNNLLGVSDKRNDWRSMEVTDAEIYAAILHTCVSRDQEVIE